MANNKLKNWYDSETIFQLNPLAVNFYRISIYNPEIFDLKDIILFEYMIYMAGRIGHDPKKYITKTIVEMDTRLKRGAVNSALNKLRRLGYVETNRVAIVKEKPLKTRLTLFPDITKIHKELDIIYRFDHLRHEVDRRESNEMVNLFYTDLYNSLKSYKYI
jgi:hypothetical protein